MILITGATSGIGEATAKYFASKQKNLFLIGRNDQKLESLKSQLERDYKIKASIAVLDLTNLAKIESFFTDHQPELNQVECLINNAGLARGLGPTHHLSISDIQLMIQTNVTALVCMSKLMIPIFLKEGRGHIINVGSVAGSHVYPNGNVYCATKHAVKAMTQALRYDLSGSGIRVSEVSPGMVNTNFSTVRLGDKQKADQVYAGMTPLTAEDIAETIGWIFERPARINIEEITIYPTDQASPTLVHRKIQS